MLKKLLKISSACLALLKAGSKGPLTSPPISPDCKKELSCSAAAHPPPSKAGLLPCASHPSLKKNWEGSEAAKLPNLSRREI